MSPYGRAIGPKVTRAGSDFPPDFELGGIIARMTRHRHPGLRAVAASIALAAALSGCTGAVSAPPSATSAPIVAATPTPTPTPSPTPTATPSPSPSDSPTANPSVKEFWTYDMYDPRAVRWQDPDRTACTAASGLIMLNFATYWRDYAPAAGGPAPSQPRGWKPDVSYERMEELLAYQRKTGTMLLSWPGADAHGWRNSLNFYGWGTIGADVYRDMAFSTFEQAAVATVKAVALYRKPVGILGWAGDHAQMVTGYRVMGQDPRTGGTAFAVQGIYLTDPLKSDGYRNLYVSLATWKSGAKTIRFTPYKMTNSPYKDSIDGHVANTAWYGKFVIVAPVK